MSVGHAAPGVVAPAGPVQRADLVAYASVFADADKPLVRLRCHVNPASDLPKWGDAGADSFVLQLLSPTPSRQAVTPTAFVDEFSAQVGLFLDAGVRFLEIHDEPNRVDRGFTRSWEDGAAFSGWFAEVVQCLHGRFGYDVKLGFPALVAVGRPHPDVATVGDDMVFLHQCADALDSADWVALHIYWRTLDEMRGHEGVMRFPRMYLDGFPERDYIVTEFANLDPGVSSDQRGSQYAEFLTLTAQYDRVLGACGFPFRSRDPRLDPIAWMDADGTPRDIVSHISGRPRLPDPQQMPLFWPTPSRYYKRVYGQDQETYYETYGIVGGHNGVDLGLAAVAMGPSPICASLAGTVTQVALDRDGYGYHVRVRSYGPEGEAITLLYAHLSTIEVSIGMLVSRGDLLGLIDPAGDPAGAHLHLGMRVEGLHVPALQDWVNPRPYLEAQAPSAGPPPLVSS